MCVYVCVCKIAAGAHRVAVICFCMHSGSCANYKLKMPFVSGFWWKSLLQAAHVINASNEKAEKCCQLR